jgi:predicted transcriptional regulator YdeE
MKPTITDKRKITLAGMDFYGDPFREASGWSARNAIGRLWDRFNKVYDKKKDAIKHLASESGYELWIDFEGEEDKKNHYIFVGVEVDRLGDLPLELVARILPETRYAIFTLEGEEIKSDWSSRVETQWLPEAGLEQSFPFIIEYYDAQRFKGMDDSSSQMDIYVPVKS